LRNPSLTLGAGSVHISFRVSNSYTDSADFAKHAGPSPSPISSELIVARPAFTMVCIDGTPSAATSGTTPALEEQRPIAHDEAIGTPGRDGVNVPPDVPRGFPRP